MHHLKLLLENISTLAVPQSLATLKRRVNRLKDAAVQMLQLIQLNPSRFSSARFEVSLSRTRYVGDAVTDAAAILDGEMSRFNVKFVPFQDIELFLARISEYPAIVGKATAAPSFRQLALYYRVLNVLGFYDFRFKNYLDPKWVFIPVFVADPAEEPVPPLDFGTLSYGDICHLYRYVGMLKGKKFTFRSWRATGPSRKHLTPVSNGSFLTGHLVVPALYTWMQANDVPFDEVGEWVVMAGIFGTDSSKGQVPFPTEAELQGLGFRVGFRV
jgi:hypothetical protein